MPEVFTDATSTCIEFLRVIFIYVELLLQNKWLEAGMELDSWKNVCLKVSIATCL
jgi:hypothetical protein